MFIDIDDIRIHYESFGEGEPILLLHGWGGQIESWGPVIPSLAQGRKVYALDFPGFGSSAQPPKPWDVTDYTAMLLRFMDRIGLEKTDVMGHSFGGRVTILLSATAPERVGKVILVDSAGLIPKRTWRYYFKVYSYKALKRVAACRPLAALLKGVGVDAKKIVAKRGGSSDYRALPECMRATFVKVVNQDLRPYLKQIKASALLIWGCNDTDAPVYFGEIMEKEIPDAGLVVLENAGHFAYLDRFGDFDKIVKNYIHFEKRG